MEENEKKQRLVARCKISSLQLQRVHIRTLRNSRPDLKAAAARHHISSWLEVSTMYATTAHMLLNVHLMRVIHISTVQLRHIQDAG